MFQIKETKEILSTKIWCVHPAFVESVKPLILSYLNSGSASKPFAGKDDDEEETLAEKCTKLLQGVNSEARQILFLENPEGFFANKENKASEDVEFINVIDLRSSVTRYGGWCSIGSVEHRDHMIFASTCPNCIGHLMVIDTPGGSAYAMNDYQVGISAARAAGQPVISFVDGMCLSAGVAAACQTDETYALHPNCEIGCIGVMGSFVTIADGTERDGYVYHELYDPESFEKNRSYRDIANDNDTKLFLKELASTGVDFRNLVKQNRPSIKDEALHGKIYRAEEMLGVLVDGIMSLEDVVARIIAIHDGAPLIERKNLSESDNDNPKDGDDNNNDDEDETPPPTIVPKGTAPLDYTPKPTIITNNHE